MIRISINLLPPEITAEEIKKARFYKTQAIGIMVILTVAFLTSLTLTLRILQSHNVTLIKMQLAQAQQRVSNLQNTEASLFLLKNRLTVIDQYLGVPSKQALMYKLLDNLIPQSVVINSITVDKTGEVALFALAPDSASLDTLMNNLTAKENNKGKIGQVSIESLNRGRDETYRINLKIKPAP